MSTVSRVLVVPCFIKGNANSNPAEIVVIEATQTGKR